MPEVMLRTVGILDQQAEADVRIQLGSYHGRGRVEIRLFFGPQGRRDPSRRGVCLRVELLDELIAILREARRQSVGFGWLDDDGEAK